MTFAGYVVGTSGANGLQRGSPEIARPLHGRGGGCAGPDSPKREHTFQADGHTT